MKDYGELPSAITRQQAMEARREADEKYLTACINHINEVLKTSRETKTAITRSTLQEVAGCELPDIVRIILVLRDCFQEAGWTVKYDDSDQVPALTFS